MSVRRGSGIIGPSISCRILSDRGRLLDVSSEDVYGMGDILQGRHGTITDELRKTTLVADR